MQPGVATDDRVHAKRKRPPSGIVGWPSAWAKLERIDDDRQREMLARLVREGGVQGPAAMGYLASVLLWQAGLRGYAAPPASLDTATSAHIEARAKSLLEPHRASGLFPKLRKA